MNERMETATTVLSWSMFGLFVVDVILVIIAIVIMAIYTHTRRNQPRLASFLQKNKTFSLFHHILIGACTSVVLGLRSLRLILNVYTENTPLVQNIYCRITAWTWDTLIAFMVFVYIARCWDMQSKYSAASKSVKNWNVKLKERWKQYRLFFKARTHTISTFLTPRSSESFFRNSTQSLKRAFKRRSSGAKKEKKVEVNSDVNNNSGEQQSADTMDPTKRPRGGSINAIKRRSSSMIDVLTRRTDKTVEENVDGGPRKVTDEDLFEKKQYQEERRLTIPLPSSTDATDLQSDSKQEVKEQKDVDFERKKRLSLSAIDYSLLTPLGTGEQLLSRSSDQILLQHQMSAPKSKPIDDIPMIQVNKQKEVHDGSDDESSDEDIINDMSTTPTNIPKINMTIVVEKSEEDKKNTTVLKSILTRRKMERENEQDGSLSARRRIDDKLSELPRLDSARENTRRLSLKDIKRLSGRLAQEQVKNAIAQKRQNEKDTDEDTDSNDSDLEEQVDVNSMNVEAATAQTGTNFSFKLNLDSVKRDEDIELQTDLQTLFGDEFDEMDVYSDDIVDDGLGSSSGIAFRLQRTMVELLNIDATPEQHTRLSKRLSAATIKRNLQIAELQATILGGGISQTPDNNGNEGRTLTEMMSDDGPCCTLQLSLQTKLAIMAIAATLVVAIIEVVFTGVLPRYYPAGAECHKNVYTTVFTYTDPMLYIYFAGLSIVSMIFIVLAVIVTMSKVYDFFVFELRAIAFGTLLVPIAVLLTPIMYDAGVKPLYSPIQHYLLNAIFIAWMLLFQCSSIFAPAIFLVRDLNRRRGVAPSMKKMQMAQVDLNAESKDVQDTYPFDYILTDKVYRDAFRKFLVKMLCPENMFFLDEVALYQQVDSASKRRELAADILQRFIRSGSLYELNVSNYEKLSMIEKYQRLNQDCPKNLFKELESTIRFTLATDCYKKFLTSGEFRAAVAEKPKIVK